MPSWQDGLKAHLTLREVLGRRRALQRPDVRLGIATAGLERVAIHAEAKDTVRVETGDVGLDHLLRGNGRVGLGNAIGDKRVMGERRHCRDGIASAGH